MGELLLHTANPNNTHIQTSPDQTKTIAEAKDSDQQHNKKAENIQPGGIKSLASKINKHESTGAIYFLHAKTIPTALCDAIDELSSVARGS